MKCIHVSCAIVLSALAVSSASAQTSVVSLSPNSGGAVTPQTFTVVVNVPGGMANLNNIQLLFNTTASRVSACAVSYDVYTNSLSLYSDDGTQLGGRVTIGSLGSKIQNTQCQLDVSGSSVSASGNLITLNLPLKFYGAFGGQKNAYAYVQANDGSNNGGYQLEGTWTVPANPPTVVSVTPNSGIGSTQTFTVVVNDPNGYADMNNIELLFNTTPGRAGGCDVNYSVADVTYGTGSGWALGDDSGTSYIIEPPGVSGSLSNSQCTVNGPNVTGSGTWASHSGNTITLNVSLTFFPSFVGQKNAYVYAQETDALDNGGWQPEGSWTVEMAPALQSLTPNAGVGTTQTFSLVVNNPVGAAELNNIQLLFHPAVNSGPNRAYGCSVTYDVYTNSLSLYNDAGTGLAGVLTLGSSAQVSNSQCTLNGTGSSYSASLGNTAMLNVALSFAPAFTGLQHVYAYAQGNDGVSNGGWQLIGEWTPSGPSAPAVSLMPGSGRGNTQTFSEWITTPYGAAELNNIQLLLNTTATRAGGCNVSYDVYTNTLSLYNDADTGFAGALTPGSTVQVSNSQCTLNGAGSGYNPSEITFVGRQELLFVSLSFSPTFSAQENVYVFAQDNNADNTGWVQQGTWNTSYIPVPTISSVSPNSGSGLTQTFTLAGTDPNGVADVNNVQLLFNTTPSRAHSCNVSYDVSANSLSLYDDTGTIFAGAVTPGLAVQVSNSQCTLSGTGSSWNGTGNTFTLTLQLAFQATFTGQKNIYGYVQGNAAGPNGSWIQEGNWTP